MIPLSSIPHLLDKHVTLDVRGMDRLYLNAYQPRLQLAGSVAHFWKKHRSAKIVSSALMGIMSRGFVRAIQQFASSEGIPLVEFPKGDRKDELAASYLAEFNRHGKQEGVYLVGKAQEKCSTFRTATRHNPQTGGTYGWMYRTTVMCNHYYFYVFDDDFGPLFIKFSGYFPYTGRVCLNGHEYAKRQLEKAGIAYQALDNGVLSCDDPKRLQQILNELTPPKIERLFRKWLARLPQAFTAEDQAAGYRYQLSILQVEFSRTQVFDKPAHGRQFFEQVICENIDLGRPEYVSLIFQRHVNARTPGTFRTRVITEGVLPSLHVSYRSSKIKQYFKEGRALRTETTINNTRDFGLGRSLSNLTALARLGQEANERLLHVQRLSHDCLVGAERLQQLQQPRVVDGQRASALRFGDARVHALLGGLCQFQLREGFSNRQLRPAIAQLLAVDPSHYSSARLSYDLRRLRLHGLIQRIPKTHHYRLTEQGNRVAHFFTRVHNRLRTGLSDPLDDPAKGCGRPVAAALRQLQRGADQLLKLMN